MKQTTPNIQASSHIRDALQRADALPLLTEIEALGGEVYLAAGAVRDAIRSSICPSFRYRPRDFDFAIGNLDRQAFEGVLSEHGAHPNRHGGFRASFSTHQADFWRLSEAAGIVQHGVPATLTNMLRSFVLNVNAVAFELRTGLVRDLGSEQALSSGVIDLVPGALLHTESTFAAKALILATRFNLRLTPALAEFVLQHHSIPALRHEAAKAKLSVRTALAIWDRCAKESFTHERDHRSHDTSRRVPDSP